MARHLNRFLALVLLCLLLSTTVFADMGPHASVRVTVEMPEGQRPFYATLLSEKESHGPHSAVGEDALPQEYQYDAHAPREEFLEVFRIMARYRDPDGFNFQGELFYSEDGSFQWGYYPPDTFKVLLCFPDTGELVVSETQERFTFDSVFRGTIEGDRLTLSRERDVGGKVLGFLSRLVVTLILELGLAALFRYRLLPVLFINVLTQLGLNVLLAIYAHSFGGYGFFFTGVYLLLELAVLLTEWDYYCARLTKKDGAKPKKGLVFVYALLANALSFGAGLALNFLWPLAF